MPLRLVLVTCPDQSVANSIAKQLVEIGLAGCVNIISGLTSVYSWQGKIECSSEVLLLIKTKVQLLEQLKTTITELHPYELPEFISIKPEAVSEKYLAWLLDSLKS